MKNKDNFQQDEKSTEIKGRIHSKYGQFEKMCKHVPHLSPQFIYF